MQKQSNVNSISIVLNSILLCASILRERELGELVEQTWKELKNPAQWRQLKPQLIGELVAEQQLWKRVEHKPYLPTDQGKM